MWVPILEDRERRGGGYRVGGWLQARWGPRSRRTGEGAWGTCTRVPKPEKIEIKDLSGAR